jgi:hypothetical protein
MKDQKLRLRDVFAARPWGRRLMSGLAVMAGSVAALGASQGAAARVLTFEDLSGPGIVPNGYHGIAWHGQWTYYDSPDYPYTAASGDERIFNMDADYDQAQDAAFDFKAPVVFNGADFAGHPVTNVSFELYLGGSLVHTSGALAPQEVPAFLASGYSGLVDRVVVHDSGYFGVYDYYVMDNVTFSPTAGVAEPGAWAMMLAGFGGLGVVLRSKRRTFLDV